jgi:RNA polymerase sigma-70 factor (ECF subfamily)
VDHAQGKGFVLTDYAKNLIKFKARQLGRRREFLPADQADLQQQLWLMLCERVDAFDPAKASLDTFIDRVVNTAVGVILRNRRRHKRGNGFRTQSLDSVRAPRSETPEPLSTAVSADDLALRTGAEQHDETLRREDAEAVEFALAQMPDDLRGIARRPSPRPARVTRTSSSPPRGARRCAREPAQQGPAWPHPTAALAASLRHARHREEHVRVLFGHDLVISWMPPKQDVLGVAVFFKKNQKVSLFSLVSPNGIWHVGVTNFVNSTKPLRHQSID